MRSLARPSFFRAIDLLLSVTNPGMRRSCWTADDVTFERHRHSFTGPTHGLTIEIFILTRPGRRGWSLMIIKEYWWAGAETTPLKTLRWARRLNGNRSDLMAWLGAQEAALDRMSGTFGKSGAPKRSATEGGLEEMEDESGEALGLEAMR